MVNFVQSNLWNILLKKSENHLIKSKFMFTSLVSLKCSMDVQTSDDRGMLLKHETSYVTKIQDHEIINGIMLKFEIDSPLVLPFFFLNL